MTRTTQSSPYLPAIIQSKPPMARLARAPASNLKRLVSQFIPPLDEIYRGNFDQLRLVIS